MDEFKHLFPRDTASTEKYVYAGPRGGGEFELPPRDDRVEHGSKLVTEINSAVKSAEDEQARKPNQEKPKGVCLDFQSDPGFKLQLESLESRRSGIELRNSRTDENGVMHGTVFVPEGKVGIFVRKIERYAKEDDSRSGKPKNKVLVESIQAIRLASLRSFWTDAGDFPDTKEPTWWEIWLRRATNPHDAAEIFRERAQAAGIQVGQRTLRFPERFVVVACATVPQLLAIENLFDILAEVRLAKVVPSDFLQLAPRDQALLVDAVRSRTTAPSGDAPAVCHLDTGVNRGHPLIELALAEQHLLAVEPSWPASDAVGHGTEMAGLALYGCLTSLLSSDDPVALRHRLESVKILHRDLANDPDLYGKITSQAVSRIEIAEPNRSQRAFCLTVSTDGRDEGFPSSWSAALDQICSGAVEDPTRRRLFVVAAGNLQLDVRHEYPARNQVEGVEDPAQSWNCLTVGAFTERTTIHESDYQDWSPIAPSGLLSPASRTSIIWGDKSWPIKPDIVMEGGNNAIDPGSERADFVDDLSLLTTRVDPTGALFTTTGDTSGATALASRYAAIIWARYPDLWPESVRAILIHSARWTDAMLEEFPGNTSAERESRLRCYGYGVPDLSRALASLSNAATLVVEGALQPFDQFEETDGDGKKQKRVKTKDMHLHRLPWPTAILQSQGELEVRMRVTLSYFIEPSPGRRGWTRKHRYQSHGLRFEVKRPHETNDEFHKRISRAARDEEEQNTSFGSDDRSWALGSNLRVKGSVHSDTWTGTAAELADCGVITVFPVTGWWKERAHLNHWNRQARYSLIVTIETDSADVDVYTPIANQIGVSVETTIET